LQVEDQIARLLDRIGTPADEETSVTIAIECSIGFTGTPFTTLAICLLESEARRIGAHDLDRVIESVRRRLRGQPPLDSTLWDGSFAIFFNSVLRRWLGWRASQRAPP
jgi:hypothetical protein